MRFGAWESRKGVLPKGILLWERVQSGDALGVGGTQPQQGLGREAWLRTSALDSIHCYQLMGCGMSGHGVGAVSEPTGSLRSPGAVEGRLILNKASHLTLRTSPQSSESRSCWTGGQVSDLAASVPPVAVMLLDTSGLWQVRIWCQTL